MALSSYDNLSYGCFVSSLSVVWMHCPIDNRCAREMGPPYFGDPQPYNASGMGTPGPYNASDIRGRGIHVTLAIRA